MCQSHTGRLTGLWFLPKPAFGLNTNNNNNNNNNNQSGVRTSFSKWYVSIYNVYQSFGQNTLLPNSSYCAAPQVQYHSCKPFKYGAIILPRSSHHCTRQFRVTQRTQDRHYSCLWYVGLPPSCWMYGSEVLTKCREGSGNVTEPTGS